MGPSLYWKRYIQLLPFSLVLMILTFTQPALAGYEVQTKSTLRDWFEVLDSKSKTPLDVSLYSILIAFDNVGRIGYSREWGVVKAGKEDRMLELLGASFKPMGKMGRVTWPLAIGARLNVSKELIEFDHLANTVMDERESVSVFFLSSTPLFRCLCLFLFFTSCTSTDLYVAN